MHRGGRRRIVDLSVRLRESARSSDGPRSQRLRNGLVVAEVALAIVLLVGASLMIQSVRKLAAIDPGFDPESLLTVHISLPSRVPPAGTSPAQTPPARVTGREPLDRIRACGRRRGRARQRYSLDGSGGASLYVAEGHTELTGQNRPRIETSRLAGLLRRTRHPLRQRPTFLDSETTRDSSAVIVSEKIAAWFWPGQDPIGA